MRFVLVSRFLAVDPGRSASARARFDPEDEIFADHFPGMPLVPGVLLVEAMGQTGGGMLVPTVAAGRWPLLVLIENAKFRRLVRPGEEVALEATLVSRRGDAARVRTEARVDGARAADATLVFQSVPLPAEGPAREAFRAWAAARLEESGLSAAAKLPDVPR